MTHALHRHFARSFRLPIGQNDCAPLCNPCSYCSYLIIFVECSEDSINKQSWISYNRTPQVEVVLTRSVQLDSTGSAAVETSFSLACTLLCCLTRHTHPSPHRLLICQTHHHVTLFLFLCTTYRIIPSFRYIVLENISFILVKDRNWSPARSV